MILGSKIKVPGVEAEDAEIAEEDLQYNITKHRFQPIFEKLSNESNNYFKSHILIKSFEYSI